MARGDGDGDDDEQMYCAGGVKVYAVGEMDGGENMGGVDDMMNVD